MKIFWSWQSDTSGKIGRHFVRSCLDDAISILREMPDIEEPIREALHLDQDRKGVPGSPDLARLILDKIDAAAVVVADVTPVGAVAVEGANEKRLINSNIAIEVGYALKALGDNRLVMVMNSYYGGVEELPFDLRHKAGPIRFELSPSAAKPEIDAAAKELTSTLVAALRPYLSVRENAIAPFLETPFLAWSRAAYFREGEALASIGEDSDHAEFRYRGGSGFYLRVIPSRALPEPIGVARLRSEASKLRPLAGSPGPLVSLNAYGVICFEGRQAQAEMRSSTQLFQNGEIWGFTQRFFREREGVISIPTLSFEQSYYDALREYISFMKDVSGVSPPITVEFGAVGLDGIRVAMPDSFWESLWGPLESTN